MVAQVTSMSPCSAPPYRWRELFRAMITRLSVAMMRKGDNPKVSTCRMIFAEYPWKVIRTGTFLDSSTAVTKAQDAAWERTVAAAAPATPMSSAKMKIGSRMMFITAPMTTVAMPKVENPWQMMNWFSPAASTENTVPQTMMVR